MDLDWKDALSNLRGNFDEPSEAESESKDEGNQDDHAQKTPVTIVIDKKGRKGKVATIIEGFTISIDQVEEVAKKLKQKLGVGGSVREGEILIQGEHKEKVKKLLQELHFKVK